MCWKQEFQIKISNQMSITPPISVVLQLEIVNSLSKQGQLPLGLALQGRSTPIAQTLIKTGKADVNAYNGEVCARNTT